MKPILQKSFMDIHECKTIEHYTALRIANGRASKQRKEDKTAIFYAIQSTPLTDGIGITYKPQVEKLLGKKLSLSTSGIRKWGKGCYMGWHKNRWECEYVVSIQISDHAWPIGFLTEVQDNPMIEGQSAKGPVKTCLQGDALIFNGATTYHGRQRLDSNFCITLMLYYVEEGDYCDTKDKRELYGDENKTRMRLHGELQIDA